MGQPATGRREMSVLEEIFLSHPYWSDYRRRNGDQLAFFVLKWFTGWKFIPRARHLPRRKWQ